MFLRYDHKHSFKAVFVSPEKKEDKTNFRKCSMWLTICDTAAKQTRPVGGSLRHTWLYTNQVGAVVTGWLSWQSVGLEIQRPEVRTLSGAQEQFVSFFRAKEIVLTRCRCAQPACVCVYICIYIYSHVK